jgi:DNA-binding NtrC family response regulator
MVHTILIVDDEINTLKVLSATLKKSNTNVQTARSGEEALDLIKKEKYSLVISDFKMGGMSGEDLLEKVKSVSPDLPFVLLTAHGTIELAVNAMRKGAYTYLTKPVNVNLLESIVGDILLNGPSKVIEADVGMFHYLNIIGKTPAMQEVFLLIKRVSKTDANILILGESGTGKELVARAIHYTSLRADKPFIPIDCTTIPAELMESELFGYEKGASCRKNCSASCRKRKYAGLPARTKLMWMSECSLRQTETLRHPWETEIFARIYFTGSM